MAKMKKQKFDGVVYSTADNFSYVDAEPSEALATLEPKQQKLKVWLDRKSRKGKVVTIVDGYVGADDDLQRLAKKLKQKCGVGGAAKDGEILVQGDFKLKIFEMLQQDGYGVKMAGG